MLLVEDSGKQLKKMKQNLTVFSAKNIVFSVNKMVTESSQKQSVVWKQKKNVNYVNSFVYFNCSLEKYFETFNSFFRY